MNFFGVGLFEILLVLIFALVVLGPERLQTLGRQAGKLTAQWLAWQQSSPELQAVQRMRGEFEAEINALRDEILRAKEQLNVSAEVQRLQEEGRSIQFPQVMQDKLKVEPPEAEPSELSAPAELPAPTDLPDDLPASARVDAGDQVDPVGEQAAGSLPAPPASETIDTALPELPAPLEGTVPHTVPVAAAPEAAQAQVAEPPSNGHYSQVETQLKLLSEQIMQLQGELHAMRRLLATRGIVDTSRYAPPEEQDALRR